MSSFGGGPLSESADPAGGSRWRGTKLLTLGKVHYETQATKLTITTDYQGPYETCLAKQPLIGQSIAGFAPALKVTSVK